MMTRTLIENIIGLVVLLMVAGYTIAPLWFLYWLLFG